MTAPIRVVLVDDHRLVRSGVRAELGPQVHVVGEAGDVDEAVRAISSLRPDVVLLDVHLPGGGGAEVVRRVRDDTPDVRFLALSVSDAAEDVIGVVRAGARGYVTKAIDGPALTDAVLRVASGDAVFGPRLAGFVLDAFSGEPVPLEKLQRGDLVFWKGHVALAADSETLIHANAFHMAVALEPMAQEVERIAAMGTRVTSVKRLKAVA